MADCLYVAGTCDHPDCAAWPEHPPGPPEPTVEDYCADSGHQYYGDDGDGSERTMGRCYCGQVTYPPSGP